MIEYVNLGDVATYINGYAFKPEQRGKKGLPIIRIQDLNGNSHDLGFFDGEYPKQVEINAGDILISWSGSLGVYKWNKGKALLNQHIFKVLFNKIKIDKEYFCYAIRNSLAAMSQQTHGATMKHITKKDFDNILIPYPDLNVQRQIANNLEIVNELIEYYEKELILLEQLIKARFVEMFGNPVLNDKEWKQEPLRKLATKIGSGATPKGGKDTYRKEGISFIRSMNVHNGQFEYKDLAHISYEQATQLDNVTIEPNDVLLNITGASVARCCIVPADILPARVNQHVCIVRCNDSIMAKFLNYLLIDNNCQDLLWNIAGSGATREAITKQQIENLPIILPPFELQQQFADFVQQVDKSRFDIKKSIIELEREVVYD